VSKSEKDLNEIIANPLLDHSKPKPPAFIAPESDSDSDVDDDSDNDLFGHLKAAGQPTTPKSQDNIFGSSNCWTPVNVNRRHTFSSIRADMRREKEATKAASETKAAANGARKARKDIFEMSSSDSYDSE
jgi:hypothetical protein